MTTGNAADPTSQGEVVVGGNDPPPSSPALSCPISGHNKVYKCGPLYLSSKGIGWTSWKKRWFILTRTSLVFFRSDPNVVPQKGSEVNLTLGGIDLNSSGSVVVKEDKKLITVLFPDGRDGRAFTLKAETMEDLHEWRTALEEALANAPVALSVGQNGILRNDQQNATDVSSEQLKDRSTPKSLVVGRPILLALEDIDGTPSFLEKALRFLEEYGVKIEGILRQAADVDDVEHRIREYEKGKIEFSPEEDPHVIADCIKYVLRELPSSPVPASCCKALLEAFRTDRGTRVSAMRSAICETFPEPNRRLLQRILMMMQTVASNKVVNRMSISAVAACMAPLLLRPLLAGDCELENDFDVGGDGSVQLLQAAAAANHAQAIVITLLEDYENIFGEGSVTPEPYTDSDESGSESEEMTDDDDEDDYDDEDDEDDEDEATEDEYDVDENSVHELSVTGSETDENEHDQKILRSHSSGSESPEVDDVPEGRQDLPSHQPQSPVLPHHNVQGKDNIHNQSNDNAKRDTDESSLSLGVDHDEKPTFEEAPKTSHGSGGSKPTPGHVRSGRRPTAWGRTSAKKNLSMESMDFPLDEEAEILNLESEKADLLHKVEVETKTNSLLLEGLQRRKQDLVELRLALEKDVARLQEELQKQMELRAVLEGGHGVSQLPQSISTVVDEKVKEDLEEIAQAEVDVQILKQKAGDLQLQLNQREQNSWFEHDTGKAPPSPSRHRKTKSKEKQVDLRSPATSSTSEISSRSKGTNATTSALSKLTNRLNFLKERRSQIASELQNLDKGRTSSHPIQSSERGGGSEHQSRGGESAEKGQPPKGQSSEKGQSSKGQSSEKGHASKGQSSEKVKESENHDSLNNSENADKGKKSEGQSNVDWGKSESFPVPEKDRSKVTPRTFSR